MNNNELIEVIKSLKKEFVYSTTSKIWCVEINDNELNEAIRKAHDEILPTDWIYDKFFHILDDLSDYDINNLSDIENYRDEIIANLIDVANYERISWLSNVYNSEVYISEALHDRDSNDIFDILADGQYYQLSYIFDCVTELLGLKLSQLKLKN